MENVSACWVLLKVFVQELQTADVRTFLLDFFICSYRVSSHASKRNICDSSLA